MEEGQGLKSLIPALAGSDYVQSHGADMACLIVNGIDASTQSPGLRIPMPGNPELSPRDVAAILNFVRNAWGNETEEVLMPAEIQAVLAGCEEQ
jgi:mono/diheme cytochrome c family protein